MNRIDRSGTGKWTRVETLTVRALAIRRSRVCLCVYPTNRAQRRRFAAGSRLEGKRMTRRTAAERETIAPRVRVLVRDEMPLV
ncbi:MULTISPECIES: hypothetical protein [Burkholderia]|uniref:hypothetical protein n=1 Tax=Burkholderia TaxID=32008 RepID=UPI001CBE36F6|nr:MULTISPECIES: hypothetical protein [Burkholderia]MCC5027799.1 hypothetical protein [Burkholderia dolosa]